MLKYSKITVCMVIHFGVEREASLVKNPTVKVYTELSFSSYIFKLKSQKMFLYHFYRHKMSVKYFKDDTTSSELNEGYNRLYA